MGGAGTLNQPSSEHGAAGHHLPAAPCMRWPTAGAVAVGRLAPAHSLQQSQEPAEQRVAQFEPPRERSSARPAHQYGAASRCRAHSYCGEVLGAAQRPAAAGGASAGCSRVPTGSPVPVNSPCCLQAFLAVPGAGTDHAEVQEQAGPGRRRVQPQLSRLPSRRRAQPQLSRGFHPHVKAGGAGDWLGRVWEHARDMPS